MADHFKPEDASRFKPEDTSKIDPQGDIDHYEALIDKKFLRYFHLRGEDHTLEVEEIYRFQKIVMRGGVESRRTVIKFKGADRPLIMNQTNLDSMAEILGPRPSQWIGGKVTLYESVVEYFDTEERRKVRRPCIRIKAP